MTNRSTSSAQLVAGVFVGLGALLAAGCDDDEPSRVGEVCQVDAHCEKGLRCSPRGKCYRPVDCARLGKRLLSCQADLVALFEPKVSGLKPSQRAKVMADISRDLGTEVIDECKLSVDKYLGRYGVKAKEAKGQGEDPDSDKLYDCLAKSGCQSFASCILEVAKLRGGDAKKRLRLFPLPKLRFVPPQSVKLRPVRIDTDAGVPDAGADAGGADAGADAGRADAGVDAATGGKPAMRATPAAMTATPAAMTARPRPMPPPGPAMPGPAMSGGKSP